MPPERLPDADKNVDERPRDLGRKAFGFFGPLYVAYTGLEGVSKHMANARGVSSVGLIAFDSLLAFAGLHMIAEKTGYFDEVEPKETIPSPDLK